VTQLVTHPMTAALTDGCAICWLFLQTKFTDGLSYLALNSVVPIIPWFLITSFCKRFRELWGQLITNN